MKHEARYEGVMYDKEAVSRTRRGRDGNAESYVCDKEVGGAIICDSFYLYSCAQYINWSNVSVAELIIQHYLAFYTQYASETLWHKDLSI